MGRWRWVFYPRALHAVGTRPLAVTTPVSQGSVPRVRRPPLCLGLSGRSCPPPPGVEGLAGEAEAGPPGRRPRWAFAPREAPSGPQLAADRSMW